MATQLHPGEGVADAAAHTAAHTASVHGGWRGMLADWGSDRHAFQVSWGKAMFRKRD